MIRRPAPPTTLLPPSPQHAEPTSVTTKSPLLRPPPPSPGFDSNRPALHYPSQLPFKLPLQVQWVFLAPAPYAVSLTLYTWWGSELQPVLTGCRNRAHQSDSVLHFICTCTINLGLKQVASLLANCNSWAFCLYRVMGYILGWHQPCGCRLLVLWWVAHKTSLHYQPSIQRYHTPSTPSPITKSISRISEFTRKNKVRRARRH